MLEAKAINKDILKARYRWLYLILDISLFTMCLKSMLESKVGRKDILKSHYRWLYLILEKHGYVKCNVYTYIFYLSEFCSVPHFFYKTDENH